MRTEQPILLTSISAAEAISKNLFVSFTGSLCSADAKSLGVSNAVTDSGEQLPVCVSGIVLILSGDAVTKGAAVTSDANAKAVPATLAEQKINGYALDAAVGADELIRILLV